MTTRSGPDRQGDACGLAHRTWRAALLALPARAVVCLDAQLRVTAWGAGATTLVNTGRAAAIGAPFVRIAVGPADARSFERVLHEVLSGAHDGVRHDASLPAGAAAGFASWTITRIDEAAGVPGESLLLIGDDATGQRAAEHGLAASEARFSLLVHAVTDSALYLLDAEGRVSTWNLGAERLKGYPAAEAIGLPYERFFAPADVAAGMPARILDEARRVGHYRGDGVRMRRDGSTFHAEVSITALRDDRGRVTGFAKVTRDVTLRRRADEELRRSEARLAGIIGSAMDAIISTDAEQRIILFNEAAERIFGHRADDVIGRPIGILIPERYRKRHAGHMHRFDLTGRSSRSMSGGATLRALRADGSEFPIEAAISHVDAAEQRINTVILRDVTDREAADDRLRAQRAQLQQAQKMEAVGQLAGGVAHDFNNMLTAIGGYVERALLMERLPPELREDLEQVALAATRASALTRQLLTFSRRERVQPVTTDLNVAIGLSVDLLSRLIGEDIQVVTRLVREGAPVVADPVQLQQVVMNLAINARDAMPQGGVLVIDTERVPSCAARVPSGRGVPDGPGVLLTVTDSGSGMDDATRERAFEPFFTTKEPGRGTGLGLATVYAIVEQSGGAVWLDSVPGRGTTVSVCLPRAVAQPGPVRATPARGARTVARPGGNGTILVAEDEPAVRTLIVTILEEDGYRVLAAPDGVSAFELWRAHRDEVVALVTDVVMPSEGGGRLVVRIRAESPDLPVLFVSGYAEEERLPARLLAHRAALLPKPFSLGRLSESIHELLHA